MGSPTAEETEVDRLFQISPVEFVEARNRLASVLKKKGDAEGAQWVKNLARPSVSAWAVNQLYWKAKSAFEGLIAAGDRYRRAQQAALSPNSEGGDEALAEAERDRKRAIEEAMRRIRFILAEGRQTPSAPVLRRIETSLEALASHGSANPTPMNGRLSADLEAPGFGALASLAPAIAPRAKEEGPSRSTEESGRAARELADREAALIDARKALAKAEERARTAAAKLESARERMAEASAEAERAASEVESAKNLLSSREASVEEARSTLEALGRNR